MIILYHKKKKKKGKKEKEKRKPDHSDKGLAILCEPWGRKYRAIKSDDSHYPML